MTAATAEPANRRHTPRRQPTQGTVCKMKSGIGLVWNISHGGVSLLVNEPIQPGTKVSGELTTMSNTPPLPVNFHILHLSKLLTGDYCVGARFDRALSDTEMQPFLTH